MTKVLVVDDDPSLLKALRIGLTARGDDVLIAHSGAEAINQVALAGPDLVILDLGLPDIDGLEVCRRVRDVLRRARSSCCPPTATSGARWRHSTAAPTTS